eukprot:CAMPEP_0201692868 /NCGR_PEP_ID=MMETSP0578-20130828/5633_1 /ASSEMBLY_ACC=CAM_ASM_000663 /TAXON_ID=267565 /ORGANISM="Skeletonema grethea, Strain CCMP 1804" /LENGTH=894 /DNA_ID=CAMNT_0048178315 /DNA_START=9 /DNA_END=2693 /DNA_ORIENTATION=+
MRVSDFVSSSFDRFDQQYNTSCSRSNMMTTNGPSSSSSANCGSNHNVLTTAEEQSQSAGNSRSNNGHSDGSSAEDVVPMSFAHSILLDLLRRSNNDLQNYNGTTSLPLLLIALARVIIALVSLLFSICGIVLHVLLAVTIRLLFVVVDGVSLVQRVLWRVVERVVTRIAVRMEWQQQKHNHRSYHQQHQHDNRRTGHDPPDSNSHDTNTHGEAKRRGGGGKIFGILESYRKHILNQLSLLIPSTTTRNKLDTLPDIMNNTPPSLSLFALVTALAFIVHPDGLTWIVLGKLCEGVWLGLKLVRGAATAIVAAMLTTSEEGGGGGGGGNSIGSETLSSIVASAVLASLIMLGKVMYRALYKKNTVTDAQQANSSTSSSSSKKKKGRRGRNSGRHGNHHNNRSGGHRNNKKDATADSSAMSSRTDSSLSTNGHDSKQHQQQQQEALRSRSRSRSLPPCATTARSDSTTSFVEEKESRTDDAIPKPKVAGCDDNEAASTESKEERNNGKKDNGKSSSPVQQLPLDPARDILSKLRPDSTDSLSVPQLSDEDVSLGSSVSGSQVVVDCGSKQGGGGGTNRGRNNGSSNNNTKKRGGARGKYNGGGGPTSTNGNGMVRTPPGFISKDSKSPSLSRNTVTHSKSYSGKNPSSYERNYDRKQKQPFFPKKKSRDLNHHHQQQRGPRTRASTSDCVIREHEVHSSPLFSGNNGALPTGGKRVSLSASSTPLSSGQNQHRVQPEQRLRVSSTNELTSTYQLSNQISNESSLLNNGAMMRNNLHSPISPPVIRPPPGLGFGRPVEMNSIGHSGGVGGVELAPAKNRHAIPGPTLSLSSPARPQPQPQARQYSSYDQSNFLLQPSVFPSMSNNNKMMKESETSEADRIDADLQQLGDQMVGSVLDF